MKSVVVEGSTLAKAIEAAWVKAEKPEEFFVRVLQEHSSGFLGFGAQKAKIVLFFKNSTKSESALPTLLSQKEYASFFNNKQLKNPEQINIIDTQLNKNSVQQPKQPHHKQKPAQQVMHAKQPQELQKKVESKKINPEPVIHQQGKLHQTAPQSLKSSQKPQGTDKKIELVKNNKPIEKKEVVAAVAKTLQKIQSLKMIENITKPAHKQAINLPLEKKTEKPKLSQPKFESYEKFMDAQSEKQSSKITQTEISKPVPTQETIILKNQLPGTGDKKTGFIKMKRRPLSTDNQETASSSTPSENDVNAKNILTTHHEKQ